MRKLLVIGIFLLTSFSAKATSPTPVNPEIEYVTCRFQLGLHPSLCLFLYEELANNYGGSTGHGFHPVNIVNAGVTNARNAYDQALRAYYSAIEACWTGGGSCANLDQLASAVRSAETSLRQAERAATSSVASVIGSFPSNFGGNGGGLDLVAIAQALQQEQADRRAAEQAAVNQLLTLFTNGSSFDLLAAILLQ